MALSSNSKYAKVCLPGLCADINEVIATLNTQAVPLPVGQMTAVIPLNIVAFRSMMCLHCLGSVYVPRAARNPLGFRDYMKYLGVQIFEFVRVQIRRFAQRNGDHDLRDGDDDLDQFYVHNGFPIFLPKSYILPTICAYFLRNHNCCCCCCFFLLLSACCGERGHDLRSNPAGV